MDNQHLINVEFINCCFEYFRYDSRININQINSILEKGVDINVKYEGETMLLNAVKFRELHFSFICCLLKNGADPDIQDEKGNYPLLETLLRSLTKNYINDENYYYIRELLIRGANPDLLDDSGRSFNNQFLLLTRNKNKDDIEKLITVNLKPATKINSKIGKNDIIFQLFKK
jgi:ankyrin repeat protein